MHITVLHSNNFRVSPLLLVAWNTTKEVIYFFIRPIYSATTEVIAFPNNFPLTDSTNFQLILTLVSFVILIGYFFDLFVRNFFTALPVLFIAYH